MFRPITGVLFLGAALSLAAGAQQTERVVIVTADGLRWQEVFGGLDDTLTESGADTGVENPGALRERYWRDTAEERRETLLPFLWNTIAKEGVLIGDPERNAKVRVTNNYRVSYPGYSEILTGSAHPDIKGNARERNPQTTVLEFVQNELSLPYTGVAAFCSWDVFNWIVSKEEDPFYCNAGYEAVPAELLAEGMEPWNAVQFDMLTPWDTVRFDTVTFEMGLAFLKKYEPTLLYLSLGETDDWAHNKRYDRYIETARYFDDALEKLWTTLQQLETYRGKTTLIITSDHGRGDNAKTWNGHSPVIPGCEFIWMAVIGPDTPAGGVLSDTGEVTQGQVAATAAKLLGLDYNAFAPDAAPPLDLAINE